MLNNDYLAVFNLPALTAAWFHELGAGGVASSVDRGCTWDLTVEHDRTGHSKLVANETCETPSKGGETVRRKRHESFAWSKPRQRFIATK
jgi:hypothetical protein